MAYIADSPAVMASRVYLGFQIHDNTSEQQHATEFNPYSITYDLDGRSRDPQFAATMVKANADFDSLSEAERVQVERHVMTGLSTWGYA